MDSDDYQKLGVASAAGAVGVASAAGLSTGGAVGTALAATSTGGIVQIVGGIAAATGPVGLTILGIGFVGVSVWAFFKSSK